MSDMNHLNEDGSVRMVDVGSKPETNRLDAFIPPEI